MEPRQSKEVMGVWKNPKIKTEEQIRAINKKLNEWKNMRRNRYLPKKNTWVVFRGKTWEGIK